MSVSSNPASPANASEVRERLEEALRLNLIGPGADGPLATEELPGWIRPSNWYLTGFLVPTGARVEQRADDDAEDDSVNEVADRAGLAEESAEDMKAAKRSFFPSSIGLSFLVAPDAAELLATVRWGEYERGEAAEARDRDGNPLPVWRRMSRDETVPLPLGAADAARVRDVPGSGGLRLHMVERPLTGAALGRGGPPGGIPPGARAVSVFLVNDRAAPKDAKHAGSGDVFQAEIEVGCEAAFIGRPDPRWRRPRDWDAEVADLHYADTPEYATGHGVSADWETAADGACRRVRTTWIPRAEVEKIETAEIPGVELSMDALGAASSGAEAGPMLQPLVAAYREWIETGRLAIRDLAESRRATADQLLLQAEVAADRIERGIAILAADKDALDAFRMANRAVAQALRTRNQEEGPKWRAFQIGFILLNLPGLADPSDPHRETADLLFFPTGGGKTEAYLGLAAFAMVLRRLRNPEDGGRAGAGVSVIMRYTLRLLTFDQLGRAAGLVCALELEREKDPARYGQWPFEIGLWVGKGCHSQRDGAPRRPAVRHREESVPGVPARSEEQTRPNPAHELPLVRDGVRAAFVLAATEPRPSPRSEGGLRPARLRLRPQPGAAHRGRGRAPLPAAAGLPHRDGGQVRFAAVDRTFRRAPRRRGPVGRRRVLRRRRTASGKTTRPVSPAARSHRPGRTPPDLRAARHDDGSLRDGH